MTSIAISINSWQLGFNKLAEALGFSLPPQNNQKQTTNIKQRKTQDSWSQYSQEIQNERNQIKILWLQGFEAQTREIKNVQTLNQALKNLNLFINKHWKEFTLEDKNKLEETARAIFEFAKDFETLIYSLITTFSPRHIIDLTINNRNFLKKNLQQKADNTEEESIYTLIDNLIIIGNSIARLTEQWDLIYEKLYLQSIPGVVESIKKEADTPPNEWVSLEDIDW